jgi:hypothetical protein
MKPNRLLFACLLLPLAACNYSQPEATLDANRIGTFAAQTAALLIDQEAPTGAWNTGAAPENVPPSPTATIQLTPTRTMIPSDSPRPAATATPTRCNWARFVADVTLPDDAVVAPSTDFSKTWRLKNVGTCNWTSGYRLVFDHGDRMDFPEWMQLTSVVVAPGDEIDITANLHSPAAAGTYQGYYKLRSSDGDIFGIGADADTAFWVRIKVGTPG